MLRQYFNCNERLEIFLTCFCNILCYVGIILIPRRIASFFLKVLYFYTHYTLSVSPYQPFSTGCGSILEAGASHVSPGISIGRIAIVVVRKLYTWSYISVLLYRWDFGLGNRIRNMLPVFWLPHQGAGRFILGLQFYVGPNHQEPEKHLEKIHWCWPGLESGPPD